MRLFGLFGRDDQPKKGARRGRGPARAADEKLKTVRARALQQALAKRPDLVERWALTEAGLLDATHQEQDKIADLIETLKSLREAGLIDDVKGAGEHAWLGSLARNLGAGLGTALVQMQLQSQQAAENQAAGGVNALTQGHGEPGGGFPEREAEGLYPPAETTVGGGGSLTPTLSQGERENGHAKQEKTSMLYSLVISQLHSRSPQESARWLVGMARRAPEAAGLIRLLSDTPDEQLPLLLDLIERVQPEAAGLIEWLRSRMDWTVETAREIRALAAARA